MGLNYGDLQFDTVKFAEKLDAMVQESKKLSIYSKIEDQLNNFPSIIFSSEDQKAQVYKSTDIIIYIVTKYVTNLMLPKVVEAMEKDNIQVTHDVETYKKIASGLLKEETTFKTIETHVQAFLDKSKTYLENNPGEKVDIDKLYELSTGSMVNMALEIFSTTSADPESFTHLVLLDDNYGYSAIVTLDPSNIIKPTKEERND